MAPFGLPGPATLAGVIGYASACASACICPLGPLGLVGTPSPLGKPVVAAAPRGWSQACWALILGYSLRDPVAPAKFPYWSPQIKACLMTCSQYFDSTLKLTLQKVYWYSLGSASDSNFSNAGSHPTQ